MSKKLKIKFIVVILLLLSAFVFCAYRSEMITVPLEIGIGTLIVIISAIFIDNKDTKDTKDCDIKVYNWELRIAYYGILIIVITCSVFCADVIKDYLK